MLTKLKRHSSPESGPNPKVKNHPESIWNMVLLFMQVEKNLFRKFFIGGPSRKFKNLAKKLSDFDKNLTTQKIICVDLLVKISSKSDNFLAKFCCGTRRGSVTNKIFAAKIFN